MTDLPAHVSIREVSMRDGLQIEDPIPLSAKLELLVAEQQGSWPFRILLQTSHPAVLRCCGSSTSTVLWWQARSSPWVRWATGLAATKAGSDA